MRVASWLLSVYFRNPYSTAVQSTFLSLSLLLPLAVSLSFSGANFPLPLRKQRTQWARFWPLADFYCLSGRVFLRCLVVAAASAAADADAVVVPPVLLYHVTQKKNRRKFWQFCHSKKIGFKETFSSQEVDFYF